jgi:hypothetical protein
MWAPDQISSENARSEEIKFSEKRPVRKDVVAAGGLFQGGGADPGGPTWTRRDCLTEFNERIES